MTGRIVGAASIAGNTTPLSCAKPTGTVDNNLMIAYQFNDYGTHAGMTSPSGWGLLTGLDRGPNAEHLKIWTRTASSEGSSYSWEMGSGVDGCVTIVTLAGVDNNPATWLWATPVWSANSQTRTAPSVSGAKPGGVLLCSCSADMNDVTGTWTPPSGMTELADVQSGTWATLSVAGLYSPPDPTGTKAFTCSVNNFWVSNGGIEWSIVVPGVSGPGVFFAVL